MKTDYRLLAKKLGECGMERKRIPHFIHLLQSAAEMFPMSDDDQKWALSKGFIPDKIDLYGLNEGNADLWVPDFDYLMMHPLNNHFKFWVDDKLTLKYMLNTPPLSDLMPEYYLYVENDGRYTYLMNMPSGVDRDEGCLSSLLRHEHALAIKPNHGMGGAGFVKLELVAEGEMAANNVIIPREEFLNLESELSGCIVTEYIRQHDDLRKIWSGSECTLRVIMAKNVGSSKYREASYTCVLAYARFGTSRTGGASNLSQGGIGVPFDFETGLLNGGGSSASQAKTRIIGSARIRIRACRSVDFACRITSRRRALFSKRARIFPLWIILDSMSSSRKTASSSARSTPFPRWTPVRPCAGPHS